MARIPFITPRGGPSGVVRLLARGLAGSRIAIGATLVAAPDAATRRFLGHTTADDPARQLALRGLGARDVVLGVGMLVALRSGGEVRQAARWLEAGVVADLADGASFLLAEDIDAPRIPMAVGALGAAAFGLALRTRLR